MAYARELYRIAEALGTTMSNLFDRNLLLVDLPAAEKLSRRAQELRRERTSHRTKRANAQRNQLPRTAPPRAAGMERNPRKRQIAACRWQTVDLPARQAVNLITVAGLIIAFLFAVMLPISDLAIGAVTGRRPLQRGICIRRTTVRVRHHGWETVEF
jgi:hypothetical protein